MLKPISRAFTRTVAERELTLVEGAKRRRVRVQIGQPVQDVETAGGMDWRCPVRITGLSAGRLPHGIGVDSLQALVDALACMEEQLSGFAETAPGRILWLGTPGHGVPKIRPAIMNALPDWPSQPASDGKRQESRRRRRSARV